MKKKRKFGRKLLRFVLALAMIISNFTGIVPGMSLTAQAAGEKAYAAYDVTTDDNKVKSDDELRNLKVTFNNMYWYIIEDNSTSATEGTVTLFMSGRVGASKFDDSSNDYSSSTVKGDLDGLLTTEGENSFKSVEDAIVAVNLTDVNVTGAKLWLLSKEEVEKLSANFRKLDTAWWWLRSPGDTGKAACVQSSNGGVTEDTLEWTFSVRPALKLDLSKVTFDSDTNTFTVGSAASYSVTITAGSNMTKTETSGAASQTGLSGAMENVVYIANDGYKFPETNDAYNTTNGITVAVSQDQKTITVSGTPTANTEITIPNAVAVSVASVTVGETTTYYTAFEGDEGAVKAWNDAADGAILTLLSDVTVNAGNNGISVTGDKTFDLNGFGMTKNGDGRFFKIESGNSLTLKDSKKDSTDPGDQHAYYIDSNGLGHVGTTDDSSLTTGIFTGGYLTGGMAYSGGAVNNNGTFVMEGGTIIGNQAASNGRKGSGGGIYNNAKLTLNDAHIIGNTGNLGGGVCTFGSNDGAGFEMTGGEISRNNASGYGGGVYSNNSFEMTGGEINSNNASYYGGGVYSSGSFEMTGGKISSNKASSYGGGVYNSGVINISDVLITDNTSVKAGGGIYNNEEFKISGAPVITGNKKGEADDNVSLGAGKLITITGAMTNTAPIGIAFESGADGVFTNTDAEGITWNDESRFKSEDKDYIVSKIPAGNNNEGQLKLLDFGDPYPYLIWDENKKVFVSEQIDRDQVTQVADQTSWNGDEDGKWFVVKSEKNITSRITVTGIVNLILLDGSKLNAKYGITVGEGDTLNIYAQSTGDLMGQLTCGALNQDAAIGVMRSDNEVKTCGTVTIHGGNITANGGPAAAGIGGGLNCNGGNVAVYGGVVTATGGNPQTIPSLGGTCGEGKGIGAGGKKPNGEELSNGSLTLGSGVMLYGNGNSVPEGSGSTDRLTIGSGSVYTGDYYKYMKTVPHKHSLSYAANGATITATCSEDGCTYPVVEDKHVVTLTITAPTLTSYGQTGEGISAEATLDGLTDFNTATQKTISVIDIKYYKATLNEGVYTKNGDALSKAPTDAGDYIAEITLTGVKTDDGENKSVTAFVGYSIAKATPQVTAPTGKNQTYTGSSQKLIEAGSTSGGTMKYAVTTANQEPAAEAYTFDNTSIPTATEAGTYFVWYRVVGDDYHNGVSANSISVSIGKKALTVTADAKSREYGAEDPELTYTAEGLVEGDTISGNLVRAEGENVGTYAINKGTLNAGANYDMNFTQGLFTIIKTDADISSPSANELAYNGQEQELVTAGTVSGGSILYSLDGSSYDREIPKAKDAGEYTVYYKVTGDDNHNDAEAEQITVTILKKSLTITADARSKKYGESDPELTYTGDGLIEGDEITGVLSRDAGENVGVYNINKGSVSAGNNYEPSFTGAKFTIEKSDVQITPPAAAELTYNGQDQELVKKGTVSGGSIQYSTDGNSYSADVPKAKKAGAYTVYYKVTGDDNHNDVAPVQIAVTITKKDLTITADAKSKVFGTKDPELTYTESGLIDGDEITGALSRAEGESVGTYAISQGTLTAGENYIIKFTEASLEIVKADKAALDKAIKEAEEYYDSIKGNENYKAAAAALKEAIDAAKAVSIKEELTDAEIAEALKAIISALEKAKAEIKVLSGAAEEEKAEERAKINKLRTDEVAKLLSKKESGTVYGMYQTNYDTVSCDIIITKGKITTVSFSKDSIKEGKNYLTFNTGTRIILGEAYTVSDNFANPKDYKKAKKFVKKKKDGYVLDLKPLKNTKGKSYELVLIGDKKELIIDVVDVSLNKKGLKTPELTTAVTESAVSANAVSENLIGDAGSMNKNGVLTIATSPSVKAGIKGRENRTARFITGVWNVAGQEVASGGVQTITKGKVKVYAMVKEDGTLSIAKAEGSGKGGVSIEYTLNGQAKVAHGRVKFKSRVYKAKIKVQ